MPALVGMNLDEAQQTLIASGIVRVPSWYQFQPWPISVAWRSGEPAGQVTAQLPGAGDEVAAGTVIALTVNEFSSGVAYP